VRRALLSLVAGALACAGAAGGPPRVSSDGYHGVRFGMTPAEAAAAYGAPLAPAAPVPERERGCYYVTASGAPGFMVVDERVARLDVREPGILTDANVGVGSLEFEVLAAYGERAEVSPHKYTDGHYITIDAGEHSLVFETDGTRVTRYRAGREPEVQWVEGCS
jgi:hypothetical protein